MEQIQLFRIKAAGHNLSNIGKLILASNVLAIIAYIHVFNSNDIDNIGIYYIIYGLGFFLLSVGILVNIFNAASNLKSCGLKTNQEIHIVENIDTETNSNAFSLRLGESYNRGIIVFIDESGKHGLVCSQEDLSKIATWTDAKDFCSNYEVDSCKDWRLPTSDELTLIYKSLHQKGKGNFDNNIYWSSSESDSYAWYQNFASGTMSSTFKEAKACVRAVRAF